MDTLAKAVDPLVDEALAALLAAAIERREAQLIELWWELGEHGPTLGSPDAGGSVEARTRYLTPLLATLVGALRGSDSHRAVYLDERLRYVDPELSPHDRAELLGTCLAVEVAAVADLLRDEVAAETVDRALGRLHEQLVAVPREPLRIMLIGDCFFVETRAMLKALCESAQIPIDVRQVFFSARQPLAEVNTAITRTVESYRPDLIGLSLFTYEGIPPFRAAWTIASRPLASLPVAGTAASLTQVLAETVADIRTVSTAPVLVHTPGGVPLTPRRKRYSALPANSRTQRRLVRELSRAIGELVEQTENTLLVEESSIFVGGGRTARSELAAVRAG